MASWLGGLCLLAALGQPGAVYEAAPRTSDSELQRAIQLVLDGDYSGGLTALDASLRRLEGARGKSADRAAAQLYAGVALVARGQSAAGRERFRRTLAEDPTLTLSSEHFPPKVTELFAAARAELARSREQAPAPQSLRPVRSTSGSLGTRRGSTFVVEDARSVFEPPTDKQAVVYFEWDAPAGSYRLRGAWRDPRGSLVLQPEIEVVSTGGRVGAYWFLALPESAAAGQWTLEISHEGRPVGQHAIQILARRAEHAGDVASDDLYGLVAPALVVIERRDTEGRTFGRGLGFFIGPDRVATAFQVVEGARSLRLLLSDERSLVSERIAAWNRWQDWALIEVPSASRPELSLARQALSDRQKYRVVDLDGDDKPYLGRAVAVSLARAQGKAGDRLRLSVAGGPTEAASRLLLPREAAGGPILDGRGEVVGILGGSLTPGESSAEGRLTLGPSMGSPASLLTMPQGPGATLGELIARGESLEPSRRGDLTRVVLAKRVQVSGSLTTPDEETTEFTRTDRALWAWALWAPRAKRSVGLRTRVLDVDGALLGEGEPVRAQFEAGQSQTSSWQLDLSGLPEGVHRVEVLADSEVVWRGYFHLRE